MNILFQLNYHALVSHTTVSFYIYHYTKCSSNKYGRKSACEEYLYKLSNESN